MSLRNLQFGKLSMEEKGKVVTIQIDEQEEDLQALIVVVEEEEDMEVDIQPMHSVARLPEYVPLWKGKAKVPKDLDATKSALQTLLLLDGIKFEGLLVGCVPTLKFEDWDLVDSKKFPHLETESLMKQNMEGLVITLQP